MIIEEILTFTNRQQFRQWLTEYHDTATECWVVIKKGRPADEECLYYLDAVEEALCFGWIDSTNRTHEGRTVQRFTPRKKSGKWSELNIERCKRLEKLGLMTERGLKALPKTTVGQKIDADIMRAFHENPVAWENFCLMPELYRRVRIDTIQRDKHKDLELFNKRVNRLILNSVKGQLFGDWNDYGRLLDY